MKKILNSKLLLIIPLLIIMIISFLNMQNAKLISSLYQNNLSKQILWYILGFIIILIIRKLNVNTLLKYTKFYYYFSILLLFLVLIFGKITNGARAWFDLGAISFQPSEVAKIALALYLSEIAANWKNTGLKSELKLIIKFAILVIIPSILVFLEPDTGAIIFYFLIAFAILITTPIHKFWFILLFLIIALFFGVFILLYLFNQDLLINLIGTSFFYRVERIISFQTESSYQLENALTAMGATTIFGTGLNKIAIYIPEAPTDFIFAFNISNFGLISGYLILISYLCIDLYLITQFINTKNKKTKLIIISFIFIFIFGQIINIGMNLGLVPIIGIPLPFLSYGGSTLIIYFIYLGLILKLTNQKIAT